MIDGTSQGRGLSASSGLYSSLSAPSVAGATATLLLPGSFGGSFLPLDEQQLYLKSWLSSQVFVVSAANWSSIKPMADAACTALLATDAQLLGASALPPGSLLCTNSASFVFWLWHGISTMTTMIGYSSASLSDYATAQVAVDLRTGNPVLATLRGITTTEFAAPGAPAMSLNLLPLSVCNPSSVIYDPTSLSLLAACGNGLISLSGSAAVPFLPSSLSNACLSPSWVLVNSLTGSVYMLCDAGALCIRGSEVTARFACNHAVEDKARFWIVMGCGSVLAIINERLERSQSVTYVPVAPCTAVAGIAVASSGLYYLTCVNGVFMLDPASLVVTATALTVGSQGCNYYTSFGFQSITVDSSGSVYCVCETSGAGQGGGSGSIAVKLANNGVISTVVLPSKCQPSALLLDPRTSNLIVGCTGDTIGLYLVNSVAGTCTTIDARCLQPTALMFDSSWNLYSSCYGSGIFRFSSSFTNPSLVLSQTCTTGTSSNGGGGLTLSPVGVLYATCDTSSISPLVALSSPDYQCPLGTFWWSNSCSPCVPGTHRDINTTMRFQCEACPSGTVAPQLGMADCTVCSAGRYAPSSVAGCVHCPEGAVSSAGASACQFCDAGRFVSSVSSCHDCLAGRSSFGLSSSCDACPSGWVSGAAASFCTPCSAGRYRFNASNCEECGENELSGVGAAACDVCPLGRYAPIGSLDCSGCAAGFEKTSIRNTTFACVACGAGTFSPGAGMPCDACNPGAVSNSSAGGCVPCGAGSSANSTAHPWPCDDCASGSYAPTAGSPTCTACPAGSVQNLTGQTSCIQCDIGQYASSSLQCANCAAGRFGSSGGLSSSACSGDCPLVEHRQYPERPRATQQRTK